MKVVRGTNFRYKISKYWVCNVHHDDCSQHWCMVYTKAVKRVDTPLFTRRKIFFFFLYLYEMMNGLT